MRNDCLITSEIELDHGKSSLITEIELDHGNRAPSDGLCIARDVLQGVRDAGRVHGGWGTRAEAEIDPDRDCGVSCTRGRASGQRLLLSR